MAEYMIGICQRCGYLLKRRSPASYAVCNRDHEATEVELSFPFTREDQKIVRCILQRLRRQRKKLGKNVNDPPPLSMESVTLVAMWLGLKEIRKMNITQVLDDFKKYGLEP